MMMMADNSLLSLECLSRNNNFNYEVITWLKQHSFKNREENKSLPLESTIVVNDAADLEVICVSFIYVEFVFVNLQALALFLALLNQAGKNNYELMDNGLMD